MRTRKKEKQGMTAFTALLIAFIVLKLCGVIAWSWWWVLSPIWLPLIAVIVFLIAVAIIGGIISLFVRKKD
jgi:ABC-type polysaccharide/polyol phosphate export permease